MLDLKKNPNYLNIWESSENLRKKCLILSFNSSKQVLSLLSQKNSRLKI